MTATNYPILSWLAFVAYKGTVVRYILFGLCHFKKSKSFAGPSPFFFLPATLPFVLGTVMKKLNSFYSILLARRAASEVLIIC